jgi:hypothetical protein
MRASTGLSRRTVTLQGIRRFDQRATHTSSIALMNSGHKTDYPGWIMPLFSVPLKAVKASLESFNEKLFS